MPRLIWTKHHKGTNCYIEETFFADYRITTSDRRFSHAKLVVYGANIHGWAFSYSGFWYPTTSISLEETGEGQHIFIPVVREGCIKQKCKITADLIANGGFDGSMDTNSASGRGHAKLSVPEEDISLDFILDPHVKVGDEGTKVTAKATTGGTHGPHASIEYEGKWQGTTGGSDSLSMTPYSKTKEYSCIDMPVRVTQTSTVGVSTFCDSWTVGRASVNLQVDVRNYLDPLTVEIECTCPIPDGLPPPLGDINERQLHSVRAALDLVIKQRAGVLLPLVGNEPASDGRSDKLNDAMAGQLQKLIATAFSRDQFNEIETLKSQIIRSVPDTFDEWFSAQRRIAELSGQEWLLRQTLQTLADGYVAEEAGLDELLSIVQDTGPQGGSPSVRAGRGGKKAPAGKGE